MTVYPACPDLCRRRLLQVTAMTPLLASLPVWAASHPDLQRIIALEWYPAELLMTLGITPLGVADTYNYRLWVGEPRLDEQVIDVGQRTEPNLELLQQLKPSLLLISSGYGPSPEKLQAIAPTMGFAFNDGSGKPLMLARNSLNILAERLGLQAVAERHLADFDLFLKQTRQQLQPVVKQPLLLFSFLDTRHVLVFGRGSLFQDVMDQLGLENAWSGETNFWGSAIIGLERLATVKNAQAICFDHGNRSMLEKVSSTPLWQSLPFVRQQQLKLVPAVWFYGATLSAIRFCRLLTETLGKTS
ncbi:Fe(3+)-hydroxamate ABC transporter substrate-binding protein FhuD [Edaphovirga cremea]|uniref:Fe(3+)-hydroxamate ABC transporter substrate-binding protein FhuD n=1 Tax=Edaphovirga cremea TaxID=2267246 RepID=UPI000DEF4BA6|nr:Fe(3+)-hydroxamate ABC transporter substrate-binding protein FhuD [Edaphovirga cremea]